MFVLIVTVGGIILDNYKLELNMIDNLIKYKKIFKNHWTAILTILLDLSNFCNTI